MPAPEVYYEVAAKALDAQMQQVDQLDTKVSTVYAAATGVLAVFAALIALAAHPAHGWVHVAVLVCFGLACGAYIALTVFLLLAIQVGKWAYGPKLEKVQRHSQNFEASGMQAWLADVCSGSIQKNEAKIEAKSCRLNLGLYSLALESFVLVLAVAFSLFFT